MTLAEEFCAGECCRNPWGTCSHHRHCAHHVNADTDHRARQTHKDPAGNTAISNVMREVKRK